MPSNKKKGRPLAGNKKHETSITGKSAVQIARNASSQHFGKVLKGAKPAGLPSKHTRRIIRSHHTLLKQQAILQKALEKEINVELQAQRTMKNKSDTHDNTLIANTSEKTHVSNDKIENLTKELQEIEEKITSNGGIEQYQKASIAGQDSSRGGDTSKLLIEWLQELGITSKSNCQYSLSLLEVGSLSAQNACSTKGVFRFVERIDLNSQDPNNIKQQDFMRRPLPGTSTQTNSQNSGTRNKTRESNGNSDTNEQVPETFDIISLSLVVNYVSDPQIRGEMLLRTTEFLKKHVYQTLKSTKQQSKRIKFADDGTVNNNSTKNNIPTEDEKSTPFPCLFFVLPAPCVTNSRYLTEDHLTKIMNYIGYTTLLKKKITNKLVYWLWKYGDAPESSLDVNDTPTVQHQVYMPSPYVKQYLNNMRVKSLNESQNKTKDVHRTSSQIDATGSSSAILQQKKKAFAKKEISPGGGKNNFAITL